MSRRKQENPQPRKRLINAEAELLQDTLTCGSCQKVFVLSEIVKFIQHKVHSCNKENSFIILEDAPPDRDFDSDHEPLAPLGKPPSISAPICNRKGLHHQHHHLHRANRSRTATVADKVGLDKVPDKGPSPPGSRVFGQHDRALHNEGVLMDGTSKFYADSRREYEEKRRLLLKEEPMVKQELKDPTLRTSPKILVNAYTNTIITEPSTYTCSTCKQTFTSAWVLVQHAQHMHGMKIYLVTSYGRNSMSSNNTVPPPSLMNSSSCVGIPLPPVLPPCTMNGPTHHHAHHHHHGVLPQQALALENHPALQLLRMPLGERQFTPSSLNAPHSLFARPSSQDFRVDMLATSSAGGGNGDSSQFHRFNHQSHSVPNPLTPSLGIGGFDPQHNPFMDRGPTLTRPPPIGLGFEPQMDQIYSQRLRQLAGATSPTTTMTSSPRKLTPPSFPHPPMSTSSQPSTPTSTPQPVLNLHSSGGGGSSGGNGNVTPASTSSQPILNNTHQAHQGSSASSTSSKGGNMTDVQEGGGGSPKLPKSWPCEFCGKAFRFQSNLTVHRRSHTGEKPYKCPICRHSCTQASKLKRHMKTHQSDNNGKASGGGSEENNSMESPRSTPDSTTEGAKGNGTNRRLSLDDDEDGSDGQTAEEEEEDEEEEEEEEDLDDDDELEEEEELDDEGDLDDSNEVMMAEDLSTRGPTSSTPIPRSSPSDSGKTKNNDITNNDNNSSNTISVSNGDNEESRPDQRHSLLSEVMDKIGLSNIQHYNEAYQKALEESSLKNSLKDSHADNNGNGERSKSVTENGGSERLSRDEGNTNTNSHCNSNSKSAHSMDFGHGFFGAFDYHHHHHHNAFQASKRLKLDMAEHIRGDRDSLYAGLWLPSVHNSRDLFVNHSEAAGHNKSSSSESALKSVTPTNLSSRSLSPRPGTSGGGHSATPSSLLLNSKSSVKEQRRNDTCEYCGKVFKNCSNLTVHRRSHTGEKPYKCELCSYACAQSSKLTRHMKTHGRLGKDVYRCRFCDMPFSVPSTLEKHMRKCVVNQNASAYLDRDSDSKELT